MKNQLRFSTFVDRVLLKRFQKRSVSSPAPVTMASPSGDIAFIVQGIDNIRTLGKARRLGTLKQDNVTYQIEYPV